jgi:radical SAM superfamily enzyme YgiQ (UPF0313 family)
MTKVVFINMPLRESAPPNCAPNGVAILAAILRNHGIEPHILDLNAVRVKDAEALANGWSHGRLMTFQEAEGYIGRCLEKIGEPDVVALSGMITTLRWQEEVSKMIRRNCAGSFLVSGGGLATEFGTGLFEWIPELDGIGCGEGDESILKVVADAVAMKEMGKRGAEESGKLKPYCLGEVGGKLRFSYEGVRPSNLDVTPFPAYDLLEMDPLGNKPLSVYLGNPIWGDGSMNSSAGGFKVNRSINTISSRGCPHACSYCYKGTTGERHYGALSADRLVTEIENLACNLNVDFVGILDDNFMVGRKRIMDMVDEMEKLSLNSNVRWGTHGRLDEAADLRPGHGVNDPKRVDLMARAGCVYIGFGGESADAETLKNMGKGGFILSNGFEKINGYKFPKTMLEGIRNTRRAGIQANLTWIMSFPQETLEQLKTTAAFIKWQEEFYKSCGDKSGTVNKNMFVASAYPGTQMFNHPKVKEILGREFGIKWGRDGQPIRDAALRSYVLSLDDATKVLSGTSGKPIFYGDMPEDDFIEARGHIERGDLDAVLAMPGRAM